MTWHFVNTLAAVPLGLKISSLSGTPWARAMSNQRAERIECLLLHEFTKKEFILPEKIVEKKKLYNKIDSKETQEKRRSSYEGGLVLDPKVGFYSDYVLLLDFNSLYPSIIRE